MRQLQRQRDSLLYERIGLSDKRDEVLKLAREGALADLRPRNFGTVGLKS